MLQSRKIQREQLVDFDLLFSAGWQAQSFHRRRRQQSVLFAVCCALSKTIVAFRLSSWHPAHGGDFPCPTFHGQYKATCWTLNCGLGVFSGYIWELLCLKFANIARRSSSWPISGYLGDKSNQIKGECIRNGKISTDWIVKALTSSIQAGWLNYSLAESECSSWDQVEIAPSRKRIRTKSPSKMVQKDGTLKNQ